MISAQTRPAFVARESCFTPRINCGAGFFRIMPRGASAVVNKISWQKAGGVTEPGRYMFTFGWLTVTAADLAIWKQFPQATFTLVEMPTDATSEFPSSEFHLGAFELPAGPSES